MNTNDFQGGIPSAPDGPMTQVDINRVGVPDVRYPIGSARDLGNRPRPDDIGVEVNEVAQLVKND